MRYDAPYLVMRRAITRTARVDGSYYRISVAYHAYSINDALRYCRDRWQWHAIFKPSYWRPEYWVEQRGHPAHRRRTTWPE